MPGSLRSACDSKRAHRKDAQDDLDRELDKYSFTHQKDLLFDDSPNKSEMNQFGDFSGSHSQFDRSGSIERGMANLEKSTDFSFQSKSAMPPMSTISSLSSHTDSPRKTRSEGGYRSGSMDRFSPMSARKVTAIGLHESESEYSPSKYYQAVRTPHATSRLNPSSRKVSPKSFKDPATLFNDLGLDDTVQNGDKSNAPAGRSLHLPRNVPDLSTLLTSSKKTVHKVVQSVPVSEDNQKLFDALQELRIVVEGLESENILAQERTRKATESLKKAEENVRTAQQRANLAESELKKRLTSKIGPSGQDQTKVLEARNATLLTALNAVKKDLENRTTELGLARDEIGTIEDECNRVTGRLANALENVKELTNENEALKAQVVMLKAQISADTDAKKADEARERLTADKRITERLRKHTSALDKKKPSIKPPVEDSCSDEGIEVSRSVLNESEIEELTQEIERERRQNMNRRPKPSARRPSTTAKRSTSDSKNEVKPGQKPSITRNPPKDKLRMKSELVKPPKKLRKQVPILDDSERESCASFDEYEQDSDIDSDGVLSSDEENELHNFSNAEDEASRILYRRKPALQTRGKHSAASTVDVQKLVNRLSRHSSAQCTICSRKAAVKQVPIQQRQKQPLTSLDSDATIRPSQPPLPALHSVLSGLEDEFRHLKAKYQGQTDEYNKLDPSLGKKKRKALAQDLRSTVEALEVKADQIYSVFDVLEAAANGTSFNEEPARAPTPIGRREWINV